MSDENALPDDGSQADEALDKQNHEHAVDESDDETLEERLRSLVAQHARERAELAEQISQLQEKNDCLRQRIQELEQASQQQLVEASNLPGNDAHSERALGLNFSLPEERG